MQHADILARPDHPGRKGLGYAERPTGGPLSTIYSHSRLSSFENCPKKFEFRYILDIEAESEGIEAFVGKRVHEILERLYHFVQDGMVPPLDKVIRRYDAFWDEHWAGDRVRNIRTFE